MPADPSKQPLRDRLKAALAGVAPPDVAVWSSAICARLVAWEVYQRASTVMLFAPIRGEADLGSVAADAERAGKRVCVPRSDWSSRRIDAAVAGFAQLKPGRHGLMEPPAGAPSAPVTEIDLVLVPGLAFDPRGHRLGRGGGFYDRFLADPALKATTCGIGFDLQLVDSVPVTPLDIPIQWVCTPTRLLATGARRPDNAS